MCGLAGYVDFGGGALSAAVLERMAGRLVHRGPDAGAVRITGSCGLAHRRLSIIDLEHSHQPMVSAASGLALVFNGEIYNYHALRTELAAAGESFETQGDTEVLLRALEVYELDALPRLDGMFAFAAWDERRQRLLLARDPLGIKPLYFARPTAETLVFGSEVKAVLAHPLVAADLDEDALRQMLRFRAVYGERSLHRDVRQLEPGCWLEFGRDGVREGRHFDLAEHTERAAARDAQAPAENLVARGRELFEEAVRKRLIADVPVGAFLSGGLDSSLVVAAIRKLRGEGAEVCTYSVGFRDDEDSELPHARIVANAFGTRHAEVSFDEREYADALAAATMSRDAPLSEPADVAVARMSAVAKRDVKVVLSGEGADEAFCGYPKYRFADASWVLRSGLRVVGPDRVAGLARRLGLDARRVGIAARSLSHAEEPDRLMSWFTYLDRETLTTLFPGLRWSDEDWEETRRPQIAALARFANRSGPLRMQALDCLTWLPGNLLERGDRMTMSAGLEARVPFLDKALVPFGLALPKRLKIRGRIGKWMLRRWAADVLPPEIVARPKWGFRVPLASWFRGHLRSFLRGYVEHPSGLCGTYGDPREVTGLIEAHESGRVDSHLALWTLLSAEVWYQDVYLPLRTGGGSRASQSAAPEHSP